MFHFEHTLLKVKSPSDLFSTGFVYKDDPAGLPYLFSCLKEQHEVQDCKKINTPSLTVNE